MMSAFLYRKTSASYLLSKLLYNANKKKSLQIVTLKASFSFINIDGCLIFAHDSPGPPPKKFGTEHPYVQPIGKINFLDLKYTCLYIFPTVFKLVPTHPLLTFVLYSL